MNRSQKKYLLLITLLVTATITNAQHAVAVSSDPGPGLHIALNWQAHATAVKYAIYRKKDSDAKYPASPINASPIQVMTNCVTMKSILITGLDSTAWNAIAKGLSGPGLFDPCKINTIARGTEKYKRLQVLARSSMPVALVAGWGYRDNTVTAGTVYLYRILALNAANTVIDTIATDLKVTAGSFVALPPPASVVAEPGDATVLVRWTDAPGAAGYIVERAPTAAGPFQRVNESDFAAEVKSHLNGDTLIPSENGLLDFKRYKLVSGDDSTHIVKGVAINGPDNTKSYYYRVSSIDLFKRAGTFSSVAGPAIPKDKTMPSVPIDILATADDNTGKITVRWTQVTKDINGHFEKPDSLVRYKLYRFSSSEDPDNSSSVLVGEAVTIRGLKSRDTIDGSPSLRSMYGNKTWWYRLKAVDAAGNISQWSTAASAIIKDITPPDIVKEVKTKGFEDRISVRWKPNNEPDIASYMVYRSLCHLGDWVECNPKQECKEWSGYDPSKTDDKQRESNNERTAATAPRDPKAPCPCSGSFVFLGEITKDSLDRAAMLGNDFFVDRTIPPGSPLCYAYWIKAKDSSDNQGGSYPIPSAAERAEIKCERLRDRTPPESALISGLYAQAEQIRVEWFGPPTQDTRAYHVYRADGTDPSKEPLPGEYRWVGGMTVELPPVLPKVLTSPYTPPGMATCDKIAVQATQWMSQGYFEDKSIKPKLTYWYKVVGIDYDGNETSLDRAAAISTFSFTRETQAAPVVSLSQQADPCGVVVKWSPGFDASKHIGFIVYRSTTAAGPFTPIVVSPVKSDSFIDTNVVKGTTYYYQVAILMANGKLSAVSAVKNIAP